MPWYISPMRVGACIAYAYFASVQGRWILDAEDRFRRSLNWKPTVGTIFEHKIVYNKLGASHVWYKLSVDGKEYIGDRFKSGGINVEEHVKSPTLLGVGTELIVYYDPEDPSQSAVKIASDRASEVFFVFNILLCLTICYRFMNINRRFVEATGMKQQRRHNVEKPQHGYVHSTPATKPQRRR